jgi:hypothetical protein
MSSWPQPEATPGRRRGPLSGVNLPPERRPQSAARDPFLPSAVQAFRIARCSLLDHLVPGCQQCFRDGKAERLGGLKVDHQFELVRL